MCGIVGATGTGPALPFLLEGLARLEYRGYDSAGVALHVGSRLWRRRRVGRLSALTSALADAPAVATTGIGHTRWATHGRPEERNAHPHADCDGGLAVVHNGIVENHRELRAKLEAAGHVLTSDTDTEVLVHLIEDAAATGHDLAGAVRHALADIDGAFAVAVIDARHPDLVVAARRGSPLVVGRTATAGFVASDIPALAPYTREVYALDDDQIVEVRPDGLRLVAPRGARLRRERRGLEWEPQATERGDYPHFMLKEIHQQPDAIAATLGGRRGEDTGLTPEQALSPAQMEAVRRILVVGCGTSLHAGLAARPALEAWADLPVECEIASELRGRDRPLEAGTLAVGVSQSGESIDTLLALRDLARQGTPVLAVTNVVDSAIARESGAVIYTRAGPEVGVAATKTHVAQVVALQGLALALATARGTLPPAERRVIRDALGQLPGLVEQALRRAPDVAAVARRYTGTRDFFFLGRGAGYAVALEGALKLKETAYVRAEAYAAGEMKHGPIALVEPGVVVIAVVGTGPARARMLSNVAEVRARGATVVLVAVDGDHAAAEAADHVLAVPPPPAACPLLSPVVDVVPLQLFAYAIATARGCDVDKPRNLAKTVTVE
jgi:glucosamine--fructose-6-phosphate aminotransferase (isomerizing)